MELDRLGFQEDGVKSAVEIANSHNIHLLGSNLKRFYTQLSNFIMNSPYDIETIKLIDGKISHKRNIHPFNEFNYNCISILINLNNIKNKKNLIQFSP